MPKKVYELAKEIGMASKDLVDKAKDMGIDVKSHMSALTDEAVEKLKDAVSGGKASGGAKTTKAAGAKASAGTKAGAAASGAAGTKSGAASAGGAKAGAAGSARPASRIAPQPAGRKLPVGKPIVDESYLANKKKLPVGKPIVDNDFLAKREKAKAGEIAPEELEKDTAAKKAGKAAADKNAVSAPEKETAKKSAADKPKKAAEKTETAKAGKTKADEKAAPKDAKAASAKESEKKEAAAAKDADKKAASNADKKEAKAKKAKKEEPEVPKKNLDAEIKTPRVKIIKTAEEIEKEQKKARAERPKPVKPVGHKPRKPQRPQGQGGPEQEAPTPSNRRPGRAAAQSQSGDSDLKRGRKNGKKKRKDGGFDKFDKFERKSLERQERKKYTKQKPVVEEEEEEVLPEGTFKVNVPITVAGFCEQVEVSTSKVIMILMKLGIMANINQQIDEDTLMVLASELGIEVVVGTVEEDVKEEGIEDFKDDEKDLVMRPPVITVMGHVDHGKTSLLDAIRKTNVTAKESGGITQHIGASEVEINGKKIVFLDTPGHEAFTAMRARGAHITDIAVLVVAADDSVKPQTIESISHAKAAGVPIIVAINKMDKPGANPDKVKQDLADQGVLVEDWGGDVISVPVSAKKGEGITDLLEMILLQADVLELKANPNRMAKGTVIEARLDKARGPVATLLVSNGSLKSGQSIVAGTCSGHIRLMTDSKGKKIRKAGPATAVEVLGLTDVPQAGDEFNAVRDDKVARDIANSRAEKLREEVMAKNASTTLDKMFSELKEGEVKELNVVIKGDVQGSVGALISSLEKLNSDEVKVNVVHSGVGTVTESDVMLASTSGAIIIGFNVRPSTAVTTQADRDGVEIRLYRVIYDVINDVEAAMKGMLEPEFKEEVLGKAEIRDTFKVPNVGTVGGAYVTEGKVMRNAEIRLVRDGIVILEGKISSLKRFKDDAKEVAQGYECGIGIEDYNDIKEGDEIECFQMVKVEPEEA